MTAEEIRKEIELLQNVANNIKVSVGCLRSDINQLEGAIKQDNDEFEARLAEAESRGFQKGYEKGFAEGRTRKELSEENDDEIRVGDEVIAKSSESYGNAVVTNINNSREARYTYANGFHGWDRFDNLTKTGRHFDEVEKLLEEMQS